MAGGAGWGRMDGVGGRAVTMSCMVMRGLRSVSFARVLSRRASTRPHSVHPLPPVLERPGANPVLQRGGSPDRSYAILAGGGRPVRGFFHQLIGCVGEVLKPVRHSHRLSVLALLLPLFVLGGLLFSSIAALAQEREGGESEASSATTALDENAAAIAAKKQHINDLNRKISELESKRDTAADQAALIEARVEALQEQVAQARLELRQTQLAANEVEEEQQVTAENVEELTQRVREKREQLRGLLRLLYEKEQTSIVTVFLVTGSLSDLLGEREAVQRVQDQTLELMRTLQDEQRALQERQAELAEQERVLANLVEVQAAQRADLAAQEQEQAAFLAAKAEEQAQYEQKLAEAVAARKEIERNLFTLTNAGVKLSFTEATDMAKYASTLTGVRPALILAVMKIESNVGQNIGSGSYPDDMHPRSREPFLRIMAKLGRDPHTTPVSRSRSYGWGGAMGPAQVMPETWERIEPELARLMKKALPNPFELTDAVVATAYFLGSHGAFDAAREREAVGRFLAGPNWQYHSWYIDRVMAVAAEYERDI